MKQNMPNKFLVISLVFFLTALPLLILNVKAQPKTITVPDDLEDEVFSVMTDVIDLDLSSYNVELYNHNLHNPAGYGDLFLEDVAYTLESSNSKIMIVCKFIDRVLVRWDLVQLDSSQFSPIYAHTLPTSTLEAVKDVLLRNQEYSESSIIQEARSILDDVTEIKTMNVTSGNLKMRITANHIDWVHTIDGFEFPSGLSIGLNNGIIDGFVDESSFYCIGSTDVNISREEAVRMAWEESKKFTSLKIWIEGKEEIVFFHVKEEPWIVRLQVGTTDLTSYLYWYVWFVADPEVYSTTGFEVSIRADIGEIAYSQTTTYYGIGSEPDLSDTPHPTLSPSIEPTSTQTPDPEPFPTTIAVASIVTITIIGIGALTYFKKNKRN